MEEPRKVGEWTKVSTLGSGGFGVVSHWRTDKYESIAVKKCKLQCSTSLTPRQRQRWQNEVQMMKDIDHPNIVKYKPLPKLLEEELNKYNQTKLPLLSMEYCHRGNLRHYLSFPTNLRGLKEDEVRDILLDIPSAIQYLHSKGIAHRDIKPENIVIDDFPDREGNTIYKLIDLGYAKEFGDATVSFVGTLFYLAPEIFSKRKYGLSVDYWSLGVLTFEIICGLMPFPLSLNIVDRYRKIQEKGPDDICLYHDLLGNFHYSSELFKENHISSCLKNLMETWLRKALKFNPEERSSPFPNSIGFFDQLTSILKRKIVKVFSVYSYEFYSYEFDEFTRVSTLKQWICRDTKIPESEQLLLGTSSFHISNSNTLIVDCFAQSTYEVLVFRRTNVLFNKDKHCVPRMVKVMFEKILESFTWKEIKAMYAESIYLISQDLSYATYFSGAMDLYMIYLKFLVHKMDKEGQLLRDKVKKVLSEVVHINKMVKLAEPSLEQKEKLKTFFSNLDTYVKYENELARNIKRWHMKLDFIHEMYSQMNIIKLPQLHELLKKAVHLIHSVLDGADKKNMKVGDMPKIVSESMKLKNKLLTDTCLQDFVKYLNKTTEHMESLMIWMDSFRESVGEMQQTATSIMTSTIKKSLDSLTLHYRSVEHLLDKSEGLNSRTRDELEDCFSKHENFVRYIEASLKELKEEPL